MVSADPVNSLLALLLVFAILLIFLTLFADFANRCLLNCAGLVTPAAIEIPKSLACLALMNDRPCLEAF